MIFNVFNVLVERQKPLKRTHKAVAIAWKLAKAKKHEFGRKNLTQLEESNTEFTEIFPGNR